jgi:hypothetical protein
MSQVAVKSYQLLAISHMKPVADDFLLSKSGSGLFCAGLANQMKYTHRRGSKGYASQTAQAEIGDQQLFRYPAWTA